MNVTVPLLAARAAVDVRAPISMWGLLVWAYKRQMVHYEPDCDIGPQTPSQGAFLASLAQMGVVSRYGTEPSWSVNAAGTTAHPDAHRVHAVVCLLPAADRALLIASAVTGRSPDWSPDFPAYRVVPVRRGGTGRPRMIYGKSNRPIACLIDYEGIPAAEIQALRARARESYSHWWRLMRRLRLSLSLSAGHRLTRWKITDIGAPKEPWADTLDK